MTLGWIKEDAEERFYEAMASVPVKPAPPPKWECPYCNQSLGDYRALDAHLHERHTNPRPFVLLKGREPRGEDVVRTRLSPKEVNVVGASAICVSADQGAWRFVDAAALADLLGACGSRTVAIRVEGLTEWGPTTTESYRLRVRIASNAELKRADQAFVRLFGRGEARLITLDRLRAEAGSGTVDDYVGALCNYVHGVLMKDFAPGTGVGPQRVDWTESYKASLQVLAETPRPLALLLSGLMRFALNDFSSWRGATAFPLLDKAFSVLGPLTEGATPLRTRSSRMARGRTDVCPVDAGVYRIMLETNRFAGLRRWSGIDEGAARDLACSEPLGALDRAKAQAIWALTALRLGGPGAATEPLHYLLNNDCFGPWAEGHLVETHA